MQQQELPAAAGTSAGAGPPAAYLNALNLQNGNFVAQGPPPEYQNIHRNFKRWLRVVVDNVKTELLFLRVSIIVCEYIQNYTDDQEAITEANGLVLLVLNRLRALAAWKARTFKKVVITKSVSWDTGMNVYNEDSD